jgi:hypothetical protein
MVYPKFVIGANGKWHEGISVGNVGNFTPGKKELFKLCRITGTVNRLLTATLYLTWCWDNVVVAPDLAGRE